MIQEDGQQMIGALSARRSGYTGLELSAEAVVDVASKLAAKGEEPGDYEDQSEEEEDEEEAGAAVMMNEDEDFDLARESRDTGLGTLPVTEGVGGIEGDAAGLEQLGGRDILGGTGVGVGVGVGLGAGVGGIGAGIGGGFRGK